VQAGDGGGVLVDAFTTYDADHTIYERNKAQRGGGVFLEDRVEVSPGPPKVFSKAVFFASHSLFLKNVRARAHACVRACVCAASARASTLWLCVLTHVPAIG
jgi:hypothetical protein